MRLCINDFIQNVLFNSSRLYLVLLMEADGANRAQLKVHNLINA